MLYIKCKKCGWRSPFSSKIDGYTVQSRLKNKVLICPECGETLIKSKVKTRVK
jgi:NAD-dependent SIR2 family protein deacetylase